MESLDDSLASGPESFSWHCCLQLATSGLSTASIAAFASFKTYGLEFRFFKFKCGLARHAHFKSDSFGAQAGICSKCPWPVWELFLRCTDERKPPSNSEMPPGQWLALHTCVNCSSLARSVCTCEACEPSGHGDVTSGNKCVRTEVATTCACGPHVSSISCRRSQVSEGTLKRIVI